MKVQPLIGHPPLLPGESLSSLIARLAKFNNYEPRSILSSLIKGSGEFKAKGRLGNPSRISQYRYLESLTNKVAYDLYMATAHTFTEILTPPEDEVEYMELDRGLNVPLISKGVVAKQIRSELACQFCPLCLKSAPYHRLIWLPLASAACLEHQCLLINTCHKCEAHISIQDVVEVTCPNCKTDLTEAEAVSVENDCIGLFTQSMIQSWLMAGVSPISATYPLPRQLPRDLFRVIDGLRLCIMQVNQDLSLLHHADVQLHPMGLLPDPRAQTFTPYQSYCLYAAAGKGIIDWPHGFHFFLTAYRKREKKTRLRKKAIMRELGSLYVMWIQKYWKQPTLEFVQEAFNQYIVDNQASLPSASRLRRFKHTPQLNERLRYITVNQAEKLLGITYTKLRLMISSGRLMSFYEKGKTCATLLSREDVLELRDKWEQTIGLQEVMVWLGLARHVVLDLVQIGLLAAQQSHAEGYFWSFSPSSVTECLERVIGKAHSYTSGEASNEERMLSLVEVSTLLPCKLGSGGTAFILREVAEDRLRAYFPQNQVLQLGTLIFSRSDIDAYIEAVKAEKDWIGLKMVARILEINRQSVRACVRTGLISPVVVRSRTHYFDRHAIVELKSDIVLSVEASAILGVSKEVLHALIRQGRLEAIRGTKVDGTDSYIFSRKNLLRWRSSRVTLEEASQLL